MRILATDLDRTLIPNGSHKKDVACYKRLRAVLKDNDIGVIYVTGRRKGQISSAIERYDLPLPLYCITNVGTEIFRYSGGQFSPEHGWEKELSKEWDPDAGKKLEKELSGIKEIWPQDKVTWNKFKRSYYADPSTKKDILLDKIDTAIKRLSIPYSITYSVDVNRNIAQLDIMPKTASKKNALIFILKKALSKVTDDDVIVAGDSGNDLAMLLDRWKSILVKNAKEEVKTEYRNDAKDNAERRYLADGKATQYNGNYAAGILEGMIRYGWLSDEE
ncbi:MAG: HAD-IIB family hydrolase [Candidatus Woesearchaeota archaeon]